MRLTGKEWQIYLDNAWGLYDRLEGKCQCCGLFIYPALRDNFVHTESNWRGVTKEQRQNRFVFVCLELHKWQHDKPGSLEKNLCV